MFDIKDLQKANISLPIAKAIQKICKRRNIALAIDPCNPLAIHIFDNILLGTETNMSEQGYRPMAKPMQFEYAKSNLDGTIDITEKDIIKKCNKMGWNEKECPTDWHHQDILIATESMIDSIQSAIQGTDAPYRAAIVTFCLSGQCISPPYLLTVGINTSYAGFLRPANMDDKYSDFEKNPEYKSNDSLLLKVLHDYKKPTSETLSFQELFGNRTKLFERRDDFFRNDPEDVGKMQNSCREKFPSDNCNFFKVFYRPSLQYNGPPIGAPFKGSFTKANDSKSYFVPDVDVLFFLTKNKNLLQRPEMYPGNIKNGVGGMGIPSYRDFLVECNDKIREISPIKNKATIPDFFRHMGRDSYLIGDKKLKGVEFKEQMLIVHPHGWEYISSCQELISFCSTNSYYPVLHPLWYDLFQDSFGMPLVDYTTYQQ